jgi:subtilisin family serine protease
VTVAVLDSGFRGYQAFLGTLLPAVIAVHSFRGDGNLEAKDSRHGILCGEVIHALAPEARLLFANWEPDRPDQFLQAVQWARQQGARVLSCSLIMPSWSDGEGGGPVHSSLSALVGGGAKAGDMLFFACAGNTAQRHWTGRFHDAGDGYHQWAGSEKDNLLFPWGDTEVSVELCWQAAVDYDLFVVDQATHAQVASSPARKGSKRCSAVARFVPAAGHRYAVRVRLARGPAGSFHLVALGGNLDHATLSGSIPFPADGPEVIAVGAASRTGQRSPYSSCGPNSRQPKPDLVAPVPFPAQCRERPFAGTSAAAPQAAALAALCWSRHPDWAAEQIRKALFASARDLGPAGHDYETGYGMIALPER